MFWIVTRRKNAFLDFAILLHNSGALRLRQLLNFVHVTLDGVSEVGEIEGQDLGVGKTQDRQTEGLAHRPAVTEIRMGKMGVPIEPVVHQMIDPALVSPAITEV